MASIITWDLSADFEPFLCKTVSNWCTEMSIFKDGTIISSTLNWIFSRFKNSIGKEKRIQNKMTNHKICFSQFFSFQARSHTNVHGKVVSGDLPVLMSWHVIIESIPVQSHSNAVIAIAVFHVRIIWHCIWSGMSRSAHSYVWVCAKESKA